MVFSVFSCSQLFVHYVFLVRVGCNKHKVGTLDLNLLGIRDGCVCLNILVLPAHILTLKNSAGSSNAWHFEIE